jgi:hypothetical protein
MDFTKLGGRKFILCLGCGLASTILLWFGKLTSNDYVMLIGFTIGAYITGGTIENVKASINDLKEK